MVEMAPPDVAGALQAGAIDAYVMGEPFPSQAEIGGYGRVLFQARDYWPDYMSCILVVRQDLIDAVRTSSRYWSTASPVLASGSTKASRTAKMLPTSSAATTTTEALAAPVGPHPPHGPRHL